MGDSFEKAQKGLLCEVVYIHCYFKDFYHCQVEQLFAVVKEKKVVCAYCEGPYLVKNQFVTA